MDDLIGDEAEEVADQQELQRVYRQVNQRTDEDINPEELEQYIKERFQTPRFAGGDTEQTSAAPCRCMSPGRMRPRLASGLPTGAA